MVPARHVPRRIHSQVCSIMPWPLSFIRFVSILGTFRGVIFASKKCKHLYICILKIPYFGLASKFDFTFDIFGGFRKFKLKTDFLSQSLELSIAYSLSGFELTNFHGDENFQRLVWEALVCKSVSIHLVSLEAFTLSKGFGSFVRVVSMLKTFSPT